MTPAGAWSRSSHISAPHSQCPRHHWLHRNQYQWWRVWSAEGRLLRRKPTLTEEHNLAEITLLELCAPPEGVCREGVPVMPGTIFLDMPLTPSNHIQDASARNRTEGPAQGQGARSRNPAARPAAHRSRREAYGAPEEDLSVRRFSLSQHTVIANRVYIGKHVRETETSQTGTACTKHPQIHHPPLRPSHRPTPAPPSWPSHRPPAAMLPHMSSSLVPARRPTTKNFPAD